VHETVRVNLYVAAAPALVAILAVIVVGRLYPMVVRGLLRLSASSRGASGFLVLTRAARTSLASTAPAFALVLALTCSTASGSAGTGAARMPARNCVSPSARSSPNST
jgi:putative ABC transport system permease protein